MPSARLLTVRVLRGHVRRAYLQGGHVAVVRADEASHTVVGCSAAVDASTERHAAAHEVAEQRDAAGESSPRRTAIGVVAGYVAGYLGCVADAGRAIIVGESGLTVNSLGRVFAAV